MKLIETRIYRGPNLYAYRPVIRLTLDLEQLEEFPSDKIPGFVDRLLEDIPTLHEHGCSYEKPGGFAMRLREGRGSATSSSTWRSSSSASRARM